MAWDEYTAISGLQLNEISAPEGDPESTKGWIYVKDNGGVMTPYFEDDAGTVTTLFTATTVPDDTTFSGAVTIEGLLNLGDSTEFTIASGAIDISSAPTSYITVDTESDGTTDDLATISGGTNGDILVITPENDARTVVLKDGTGNLLLSGDITLDNTGDTALLLCTGTNWVELSHSAN